MFPPPGVSGGDDGDVFGHPVVQTLVDLAGGAGARVVAQPHPQCLPRPTGEVVAHKRQQTVHTDNEWFYIFRTSRPIGCSQLRELQFTDVIMIVYVDICNLNVHV